MDYCKVCKHNSKHSECLQFLNRNSPKGGSALMKNTGCSKWEPVKEATTNEQKKFYS